jgi:pimeloyl-ACP methyl ester carboxylesterase
MQPLHCITNAISSENLVLCLHGNSVDNTYFSYLIDNIINWKVIAPDFLGHGKSPRLEADEYNVSNFIQCLVDVLEKESYKKLVIIGHSFGGNMAIELLNKIKVDGICLMGSAPLTYTSDDVPYLQVPDLVLTDNPSQNELIIDAFLRNFSTALLTIDYLKETFANTDPVFRDRLLEELYAGAFSDQLLLLEANPQAKICIMYGSEDRVLNSPFLERLSKEGRLPQPHLINHAGHFPLLDEPKACFLAIQEFLTQFS